MKDVDNTYSLLGRKLKEARLERRMTQAALADGIVTRNMLSRMEHGAVLPSLPVICALAERLEVPVGYLIDDHDDGMASRNRRLLDMIGEEFAEGHYDVCLNFCQCLTDYEEQRDGIEALCRFRLAEEAMYRGELNEALKGFSQLAKESPSVGVSVSDCVLYRALLSGFLASPEAGKEEAILSSLKQFATTPHDLAILSGILSLIGQGSLVEAKAMLAVSVFEGRCYSLLCEGRIALAEGESEVARKRLLEATGFRLPPPVTCYCLTLLEACSAALKDYENAYAYLARRRELVASFSK
jgi:transcriptional regulator with XRE-family HTH domain